MAPMTLPSFQVVIPAAGDGARFRQQGYRHSKPFIRVNPLGEVMLNRVLRDLPEQVTDIICLFRSAQEDEFHEACSYPVNDRLRNVVPFFLDTKTEGAACTVRVALNFMDPARPLLVMNSDQFFKRRATGVGFLSGGLTSFLYSLETFKADVSVVTFSAEPGDARWSYVVQVPRDALEPDGWDIAPQFSRIVEKDPSYGTDATCGVYLARRTGDVLDAITAMIADDERVNGEFYFAPSLNRIPGKKVFQRVAPDTTFFSVGTPELFEHWLTTEGIREFAALVLDHPEFLKTSLVSVNK